MKVNSKIFKKHFNDNWLLNNLEYFIVNLKYF